MLLPLTAVSSTHCKAQNFPEKGKIRPNILYIMSDDHSYQTISSYGYGLNKTPNIDRIGQEGVVFRNSFICNSLSGPARAVILTGKFSHMNGYRDNAPGAIFDGSQQTFPKILQKAGYQTAVIGKWHLGSLPTGFDYYSVHTGQGTYYNPDFIEPDGNKLYQGYATDLTATNTMKWLDGRNKDKPFMVMMHFKAPHRNWMPAPGKMGMYEDVTFPIPETFYDTYEGRQAAKEQKMSVALDMEIGNDNKILGHNTDKGDLPNELYRMDSKQRRAWDNTYVPIIAEYNANPRTGKELVEWKYQRYMRDYLKCVSSVDDNIGRVIDYLKKNGLWENTIVIYTSDQGFYMGEHGWFDKRFMYEQSFRTPLLMSYPNGINKDLKDIDGLVQSIDYAPTFLDYAGIEIPSDMQGESLKPLLSGQKTSVHDAIYYHYYEYPLPHGVKRHYGIRDGRYKLVHFYFDIDKWELYDLEKDPAEMNNLIDNPSYKKVKDSMMKKLKDLQVKYKDENATNDGYIDPRFGK